MDNYYLASKQNYYTEPVYTSLYAGGALHAGPASGVQQSWFRIPQVLRIFLNPMFIIILVCIMLFIFIIDWYYICPKCYKTIYTKLLQFQGFKYTHLTNQEEEQELTPPITNTNCQF